MKLHREYKTTIDGNRVIMTLTIYGIHTYNFGDSTLIKGDIFAAMDVLNERLWKQWIQYKKQRLNLK